MLMMTLALCAAAYIAGSVNFSIIVFRMLGRGDPRYQFSGTAGTTNVYRQAGLFWAVVVFMLDFARALAVSWAALYLLPINTVPWVGLALVVGNRFPCFHQFRGGKGVGSYIGFTAALSPLTSALSCLVWVAGYSVFRVPFMASLGMIIVLSAGSMIAVSWDALPVIGTGLTTVLLLANHWPNVKHHFKLE